MREELSCAFDVLWVEGGRTMAKNAFDRPSDAVIGGRHSFSHFCQWAGICSCDSSDAQLSVVTFELYSLEALSLRPILMTA